MVTTSGFPKTGTHALVKAVRLLGHPCHVEHLPFGAKVNDKHIFIKRDPRNVVCSWLRFTGNPVTPGMFITSFRRFQEQSLVDEMAKFDGWLTDSKTLVVRYEDLIASDAEMRRIADYIDTAYISGAYESLPGMTHTWNSEHSDYRTIWTPEVDDAWRAARGFELLSRWGY